MNNRNRSKVYDAMVASMGSPGTPKSQLTREQFIEREKERGLNEQQALAEWENLKATSLIAQ